MNSMGRPTNRDDDVATTSECEYGCSDGFLYDPRVQGNVVDCPCRTTTTEKEECLMVTIDARCGCDRCEERTQDIYRMVGSCSNCGTEDILVLYRAGDPVSDQDCPTCGTYHTVRRPSQRLATPDEVPAA